MEMLKNAIEIEPAGGFVDRTGIRSPRTRHSPAPTVAAAPRPVVRAS